eukprot:gene10562-7333_t
MKYTKEPYLCVVDVPTPSRTAIYIYKYYIIILISEQLASSFVSPFQSFYLVLRPDFKLVVALRSYLSLVMNYRVVIFTTYSDGGGCSSSLVTAADTTSAPSRITCTHFAILMLLIGSCCRRPRKSGNGTSVTSITNRTEIYIYIYIYIYPQEPCVTISNKLLTTSVWLRFDHSVFLVQCSTWNIYYYCKYQISKSYTKAYNRAREQNGGKTNKRSVG